VPVGKLREPLKEKWVRPDHEPDPGPLSEQRAEQLVGPMRALICQAILNRADELAELEPDEDPDGLYTRAETEIRAWVDRYRPTKERLERKVLGTPRTPKPRGRPKGYRRGPGDAALRAEFLKLPATVRRSKLQTAKRLHRTFPSVPVNTLRQRLAKVDK